ncbi:MAG: tyrosine-type recombinase/integrase [Gaiellaceae bacterium]
MQRTEDKPVVPATVAKGRKLERTKTPGIFRRGNTYCVILRAGNGRQVKRSAKTLAEARAIKATVTADVARGEYRETSRELFAGYARRWAASYSGRTRRGINEQTLADYRKCLERDAIPFLGGVPLAQIEPRHIKELAARIARRGVSANTVRLALAPLRCCLADAHAEGLIRHNPAAGVRVATPAPSPVGDEQEGEVKRLSDAELAAFLKECPSEWRVFFQFLGEAGLRVGEATELRFRDLDPETRTLHVRRRIYRGKIARPKGGKTRSVRLSVQMTSALVAQRDARQANEDELIFAAERGGRIDPSNLMGRVLKPTAERAGIGRWPGFHTFRHTCASRLFVGGWNAKQVSRFLGHADSGFTLRVYVHLLPEDLPEVPFGALAPVEQIRRAA